MVPLLLSALVLGGPACFASTIISPAFHLIQLQQAAVGAVETARKSVPEMPEVDAVKFAGLTAEEAVKAITLPAGFSAHLFASEPQVTQPIAFAIDDRGRLWVAEGHTYPIRAKDGEGRDRIFIFEDTNGDHQFDKRTLFLDRLNLVSGLEVGFGGVWIGAAPYLLFVPDKNRDDKPDAGPEIVLDGWAWQDTHETLNTFTWGPDGWLYGCHGVFTHSRVGRPGCRDDERTRINAGIWRFHPLKKQFEVYAEGTSNPWGIDFNEYGHCFIEACVIPHLFHIIPGGRYERQAGQHFNAHTYDDIKTIADHFHWAGNRGPHAANERSGAAGGGHAHSGLMIYLGESWPAAYRGLAFMNNIHGQRFNADRLSRKGSGYKGMHEPDFLFFNDKWSQIVNLMYDHDGAVYAIDWYDKNQCHHNDPRNHDRSNGRIFKIVHGTGPANPVDLGAKTSKELVELQKSRNEWMARHARRLLQERGKNEETQRDLHQLLKTAADPVIKLRALWALHTTEGLAESLALECLNDTSEYVRSAVIQLLCEDKSPSATALEKFQQLARQDPSKLVRLYLASALQRVPPNNRWNILTALIGHAEDASDHNLPLMYWYAVEPCLQAEPERAADLLTKTSIRLLRQYIARRMTMLAT